MRKTWLLSLVLVAGMATSGWAAWIDCGDVAPSGAVTANDGCQRSDTLDQDNVTVPLVVNTDGGMFGFTDWLFAGKENLGGEDADGIDIGFYISGNGQSGDWFVNASAWAAYDDIALVFKDGKNTFLVAFSLVPDDEYGTYLSPFTNPPFDLKDNQTKDISHISAYVRIGGGGSGGNDPVPEPGTLLLLGTGLLGLAGVGRRTGKE